MPKSAHDKELARAAARREEEKRSARRRKSQLTVAALVVVVIAAGLATGAVLFGGKDERASDTLPSPQGPCNFKQPEVVPAKQLKDAPPQMKIDPERRAYSARIATSCGTMNIKLLAKDAPVAVNNFVFLAKDHWYNGLVFHRIANDISIIQTGDPGCTTRAPTCGQGDPGYEFGDELTGKEKYPPGTVAMANSGPNTNGSQFFIVTGEGGKGLGPQYTIFGKLADAQSLEVAQRIQSLPVEVREGSPPGTPADAPVDDIWIRGVKISEKKA